MTILHQIGNTVREWMLAVPLEAVRGLFVLTLVAVLVWVWRLSPRVTQPPGGARRWDENLKLGASLALILQIVIYALL